jgi:nucleotide-binding universal stress UspA family protein
VKGFRNVLVPLDFSATTAKVVEAAARVLHPEGRARLLHVVEWLPAMSEGMFGVYAHPKDMAAIHEGAKQKLAEIAKGMSAADVVVQVTEGKPAAGILEVAAREKADLIVIGAHGRGAIDHLLLGSVAERVLRKAQCAVLAVRG